LKISVALAAVSDILCTMKTLAIGSVVIIRSFGKARKVTIVEVNPCFFIGQDSNGRVAFDPTKILVS
jgi:hypothetical protein